MTEPTLSGAYAGDRISHPIKGLGTITRSPHDSDLIVMDREEHKAGMDMVYVVWDDDRFPVGKIARREVETVPDAAAAISTGV